ncbi:DnaB-like helicase C-terminal domain-containing protein [Ureibacillus sp. FSL W7-1570]|uniref:replicative DNA helicase n=1 Tax=Ureibacillus sp. FSL W7-1570 TaxID=2954593 RepID=UPI00315ADA4D
MRELNTDLLEKSILGTMMQENYLILDAGIQPEMFLSQVHRVIYQAMKELANAGKPVDYVTLLTEVDVGDAGAQYLTTIAYYANPEKFEHYADMLLDAWRERQKSAILTEALSENWTIEEIQTKLDQLYTSNMTIETSIEQDLVNMAERPFFPEKMDDFIPIDIEELAKMLCGFRQGEVTIIAGRPSMGKTDVMNHFALAAGMMGYLPIIFSLEMNRKMLLERLVALTGNINRLKMRNPYKYLSEEQKNEWMDTLYNLKNANLHIDDRAGLTVRQMRAQIRKLMNKYPTKKPIVFIDYLQIIACEEDRNNPYLNTAYISAQLKKMAKDFHCPVVCLAQLNRAVETRQNKRPVMSDIRDSGNIEQDADVIILLFRDSYYERLSPEEQSQPQQPYERLEFIVAKNRNGPTGTAYARYYKSTGRIVEEEKG